MLPRYILDDQPLEENQFIRTVTEVTPNENNLYLSDGAEISEDNERDFFTFAMRKLGYKAKKGFCVGLSLKTAEAILAGEFERFKEKIQLFLSSKPADLQLKINKAKARELEVGKDLLTSDERLVLEVDKLCHDIAVHSEPGEFFHLFEKGKGVFAQNAERTLSVTQSTMCVRTYNSGGIAFNYNPDQLVDYFTSLKNAVRNQSAAIVISNVDHTITIGYHPDKQVWTITDSESLPIREVQTEAQIAHEVLCAYQALPAPLSSTFISNVYLSSPSEEVIELMQAWKMTQNAVVADNIEFYTHTKKLHLLHTAAYGDLETLKKLLQAGCDPDEKLRETTPLFIAASQNQPEIVQALLKEEADPDLGYDDGLSPLISASENAYINVVRLLLIGGADPSKSCEDGSFPLLAAVESENSDVIRLLLSEVDPDSLDENDVSVLRGAMSDLTEDLIKGEIEQFLALRTRIRINKQTQIQQMNTHISGTSPFRFFLPASPVNTPSFPVMSDRVEKVNEKRQLSLNEREFNERDLHLN